MPGEIRTAQQIVEACNKLARQFYSMHGCGSPEGYRFDQSRHPQEKGMWNLAAAAYYWIDGTDPNEALAEIDDDSDDEE